LRLFQPEGDATLGFYIVGHARGQIAVMLASDDGIINSRSDEYGLQ
jgi:hypothetical protein